MQPEDNKALARRIFEEVLSTGDLSRMNDFTTPELLVHSGGAGAVRGRDRWMEAFSDFRDAFPDVTFTPEEILAEGDRVVTRWTMRGTHRGEYMRMPATHRPVAISGTSIYRAVGGKVIEAWVVSDELGLMRQLGAMPSAMA